MKYVCTRTCTDFSQRFWETGAVVEFTEGERVPEWFVPFNPVSLEEFVGSGPEATEPEPAEAKPTAAEAPAEPPKPTKKKGSK